MPLILDKVESVDSSCSTSFASIGSISEASNWAAEVVSGAKLSCSVDHCSSFSLVSSLTNLFWKIGNIVGRVHTLRLVETVVSDRDWLNMA